MRRRRVLTASSLRSISVCVLVAVIAVSCKQALKEDREFNVEIRYVGEQPASRRAVFDAAAAYWSTAVIGDLPDQVAGAVECGIGSVHADEVVDDLMVFVTVGELDGPGGTLAEAWMCGVRRDGALPYVGAVAFDRADIDRLEADGVLRMVAIHELGHVLGFGVLWPALGLLRDPSDVGLDGTYGADSRFDGLRARSAFRAIGGSRFGGSGVPIENDADRYGAGNLDVHWREAAFGNELMTPTLQVGVANPVSEVTIASLADLGYAVNLDAAQPYRLPEVVGDGPGDDGERPGTLNLHDDVRAEPIWVTDVAGRVVAILNP